MECCDLEQIFRASFDERIARRLLPATPLLSEILQIALTASRLSEEGRPVTFRLIVLPADSDWEGDSAAHAFAYALPFFSKSLAKLAPALNPRERALILSFVEGECLIWGRLDCPYPYRNRLRDSGQASHPGKDLVHRNETCQEINKGLVITSLHPGVLCLSLACGAEPLMFWSDDEGLVKGDFSPLPEYYFSPLQDLLLESVFASREELNVQGGGWLEG